MTRTALALALLAGCTGPPDLYLSHMSTMESETRGVVLYDDGQRGHAAMWDTTCEFDTLNGWLIEDHDLPTDTEIIQDQFEGTALARSDLGIHMIFDREDIELGGVLETRLLEDGGVLTLRRKGELCRVDIGDRTVEVDTALCTDLTSVSTDRVETLYVATGDALYGVDETGAQLFASDIDLVVHDRSNDRIYVAQLGGETLTGLDSKGVEQWSVTTDGPITSLEHMGRRGMALVMVEDLSTGRGAMQLFEGISGEEVVRHDTPSGDGDLTVSDDGTTLAVTIPGEVHFYDVLRLDETPKKRRTFGSPDPVFTD